MPYSGPALDNLIANILTPPDASAASSTEIAMIRDLHTSTATPSSHLPSMTEDLKANGGCNRNTAVAMAMVNKNDAASDYLHACYSFDQLAQCNVLGVGSTAALATNRSRRGEDRVHVSICRAPSVVLPQEPSSNSAASSDENLDFSSFSSDLLTGGAPTSTAYKLTLDICAIK